ncbi:sec1 family domain-containing protein 2-like [Rhopilema esculentum]|uniref:sec1 family domain-containing protein 2-like n=1 Tax=Rhopilema esculentum TaxID=499914 RepID=UPI0031DFFCBA
MAENFKFKLLQKLLSTVANAVVFLDDGSAECLHWMNVVDKIFSAGALSIRSIDDSKECLDSETKAVFIVKSLFTGSNLKRIEKIAKSSDFHHLVIISLVSSEIHDFVATLNQHQLGKSKVITFGEVARTLKIWMHNEFATANVIHLPLCHSNILPDLFVTPIHSDASTILPSDVARLQGFLHSKGDKRMFNSLADIDVALLPHNLQIQIKMLASSINDLFENLSIHEDCYGIGHFSKIVASELANMPNAKARRKAASKRASIVFVDRILDLVGPTSFGSDNMLDTIMEVLFKLPGHHNDVAVNMEMLFDSGNKTPDTLFPGCLAHPSDSQVEEVLNAFVMEQSKISMKFLHKKILYILKKEKIEFTDLDDRPILERVKHLLGFFRGDMKLFQKYGGVLQCIMAAVNALTAIDHDHRDEVLSAEKVITLELFGKDASKFLERILSLVTSDSNRFNVVDSLLLCLHFYSAVGGTVVIDPGLEEKFKNAITNILLDGNHNDDLLFILGHDAPSEKEVRIKVADIFERLRGIGRARHEQRQIRTLLDKNTGGQAEYKPALSQLMQLIYHPDRPELVDVEFKSHGLKDFLKTGFGLFMNVSKPRPDDHKTLYVFVIGGITFNEVRQIREIAKKLRPSAEVIVGSTRIVTPTDILEQVLCSENLFVSLD